MKLKLFIFIFSVFLLLGVGNNSYGQAAGDYGSSGTMNWIGGNWLVCTTAGTWTGATTTTTAPTTSNNVWIQTGHTVTITGAKAYSKDLHVSGTVTTGSGDFYSEGSTFAGNIDITSTGKVIDAKKWIVGAGTSSAVTINIAVGAQFLFYASSRITIVGANNCNYTITNNGTFGATTAAANNGPVVTMNGNVNLLMTGTGKTILKGINADNYSPFCNIVVDQDMTLTGSAFADIKLSHSSNVTNTTSRSFTINKGKTVSLLSGGWFGNTAQFTGIDSNNTYNINGTLDVSAGSIYFGCTANTTTGNSGSTNSQIINVGATGKIICGSVVKVEKPQAGQTLAVNVADGGSIVYPSGSYATFPSASTFSVTTAPYALLTNANSNLSFTGTVATTIGMNADMTVGNNLTFGGISSLSGSSNLTVNGTLTLGGILTGNAGSVILGSNAAINGSSSNYIDLSSGGNFVRNGVSGAATLFPVGAGSYTPMLLTNTTGTPTITAKVKTSMDNAVQDATKIVNLQWALTANNATTSDIVFQFNPSNFASGFDVNSTCDLGNYTNSWSSVNVGIPSGSNPYTVSATGLTIPATNNLYVIGNIGNVVRTAPTSSTWTGTNGINWADAANWSYGVPDNTLDAIIPEGLTNYPVISAVQAIKNLTVENGASITNNSSLNITGQAIAINGTLSGNGMYVFAGTDVQKITGNISVNHLVLDNILGIINNGTLSVNTELTIKAGAITGTAPVYSVDMPVFFTGSGTSTSGLILNPSSGNVGTLTVNGAGTFSLSNTAQVKNLVLTVGTLNNSANNITVTTSVTRTAGAFSTAPSYSGSILVTFNGTSNTIAGGEIFPVSGGFSALNVNTKSVYSISSPLTSAGDINVASGTLQMASNVSVQNVTVAAGAVFNSDNNSTSIARHTLTVGNGVAGNDALLTVDGILGNTTKWANDGIDIEISPNAKTFTITGSSSGFIGISGMRPANNSNLRALDIYINKDMYFDRDNGGAAYIEPTLTLQNGTCTYPRTLTIASGITVSFRGNGGFHGQRNVTGSTDELINNYASSSANQGDCTYIINGTLDLASSYTTTTFNLNTCSYVANTQSVIVNVKNGGTLKLANVVKMFTALSGQVADIVTEPSSKVVFGYNGTQYNVLSGTGNVPTFNFYNLEVNNTSGIALSKPMNILGTLILTAGGIRGSNVMMSGTSQQIITANGNTIENLAINNAAGVQGAPTVTGLLTVTKGDLQDYSNISNGSILFNGVSAQTANASLSTIKNLIVNNVNSVTLTGDLTVNGLLTLTSGNLKLGDSYVNIWTSGSISAASTSYVETNGNGMLIMNTPAATSTTFPVGTLAGFNPVTINPADAGRFYVNVKAGHNPALPTTDTTILPDKSLNRTWNVTPSLPTKATLTFGYNGAADANSGFDNSGADVALLHNNTSGVWEYVGTGPATPGVSTTTAKIATFDGITSFSPFTIVNPGPGAVYTNATVGTFSDIFRSKTNGNWTSSGTWELYDNATSNWVSTVLIPTETSTVTIQAGNTVTITSQAGVGNLTIEDGATLLSSTSAYTSTPFILSLGKVSSIIRNNGLFGCAIGSAAGTLGDGISISISPNCTSFQLTGTGVTGIGSLYAEAGSNNLTAVIDQNLQLRRTTSSGKQVALSMISPSGSGFSGERNLIINKGKTVSFLNNFSCLHQTAFSSAGSNAEQQGNISYDIQGTLDLKGGSVYVTSSSNSESSAHVVKFNVGKQGKMIVGGDFNFAKIQAKQAVYVNLEDSALLDVSAAPITAANFYGPSTNTTSGYGSNYVWIITNGASVYKHISGGGSSTKVFNVTVAPSDGNYATLKGNPVAIGTYTETDIYTVNVNSGSYDLYPITSFDASYATNRMWTIIPNKVNPSLGVNIKFGFNGTADESNGTFSPTLAAVSGTPATLETPAGSNISQGAACLCIYLGVANTWYDLDAWTFTLTPTTGSMGTMWDYVHYVGNAVEPYKYIWKNKAAPAICR